MQFVMKQKSFDEYLKATDVIDHTDPKIQFVAQFFMNRMMQNLADASEDVFFDPEIELARMTYEFVRDRISHSCDIDSECVTWKATGVLVKKEGICYAKSHLLAALLRANGIPAGICYQYLRRDGTEQSSLILHGLNAVYFASLGEWIRLDARGNKPGVHAEFSIEEEKLAFPTHPGLGELDIPMIFADPDPSVLHALQNYDCLADLMEHLPQTLYGGR
jgi:transglutaminase-like putative cysteine protease